MSDLVAVASDDRATAERVRDELFQLTREHVVTLDDAVVVSRGSNRAMGSEERLRSALGEGAAAGSS